jgi:polyisoprenoid-binding protein YceI
MKATALLLTLIFLPGLKIQAAETSLELDPTQTQVGFTLSDVLHTVHGNFKLKHGKIDYDFATGKASGEIVIDAASGDSGSGARDSRMKKNVLETNRFPEIVFLPDHVEGTLAKAIVHGNFRIHGGDHEMTMVVTATAEGPKLEIRTQFAVPYVDWGMKDPSTFVLKVGKTVDIDIHASGRAQ